MKFEKNVGKKEGILRVVVGIALLILMVWTHGWVRWISGLAGISFIMTAIAST